MSALDINNIDIVDDPYCIAAVRQWRVAPNLWARMGGLLWSDVMREPWPSEEEFEATCDRGCPDVPGLHCRCGVYACFDYETLARVWGRNLSNTDGFRHVAGVLAIRGVWVEHTAGLRARYATVAALFDDVPDSELHGTMVAKC